MAQFILGFIFGALVAGVAGFVVVRRYKCQVIELMNKINGEPCAKKTDDCGCS